MGEVQSKVEIASSEPRIEAELDSFGCLGEAVLLGRRHRVSVMARTGCECLLITKVPPNQIAILTVRILALTMIVIRTLCPTPALILLPSSHPSPCPHAHSHAYPQADLEGLLKVAAMRDMARHMCKMLLKRELDTSLRRKLGDTLRIVQMPQSPLRAALRIQLSWSRFCNSRSQRGTLYQLIMNEFSSLEGVTRESVAETVLARLARLEVASARQLEANQTLLHENVILKRMITEIHADLMPKASASRVPKGQVEGSGIYPPTPARGLAEGAGGYTPKPPRDANSNLAPNGELQTDSPTRKSSKLQLSPNRILSNVVLDGSDRSRSEHVHL